MRFNVGRLSEPFLFLVALVSVVVLWSSACALVWTQYRVRLLFTEIERANDMARRLSDDSSQLALDLSKAALPGAVSEKARQMGFAPADLAATVLLEVSPEELAQRHLEVRK